MHGNAQQQNHNFVFLVSTGDNRKTVLLKSSECSPEVINFLTNKACQCYVALCDWASVKEWQTTINALKQNSTNPVSINLRTDFNYIQALSRFEDGDLSECGAQLELLPGEDYSSLSSSKEKLGKTCQQSKPAKIGLCIGVFK